VLSRIPITSIDELTKRNIMPIAPDITGAVEAPPIIKLRLRK
jgi:hypothetical protein